MSRDDDTAQGGLAGRGSLLLDKDEVLGVLSGSFYSPREETLPPPSPRATPAAPRPTHYKVICISLYTKDLDLLDGMVDTLKAKGITKASRSALIRAALEQVDLDKVPRGM